jgi:hypothetical protein
MFFLMVSVIDFVFLLVSVMVGNSCPRDFLVLLQSTSDNLLLIFLARFSSVLPELYISFTIQESPKLS